MMGGSNFTDYHSEKKKARKKGIFSDDEDDDAFQDLYRGDKRTHVNRNQGTQPKGEQDFWKAAQDRETSKQDF